METVRVRLFRALHAMKDIERAEAKCRSQDGLAAIARDRRKVISTLNGISATLLINRNPDLEFRVRLLAGELHRKSLTDRQTPINVATGDVADEGGQG